MRRLIPILVYAFAALLLSVWLSWAVLLQMLPQIRSSDLALYYTSVLSVIPLTLAYFVLLLLFWVIVRLTRGLRMHALLLAPVGAVFLVLPVAEELWIAWNFAQACKQAGTFISKKVQVDGFYDDTGASLELVRSGAYRFVEGPSEKGAVRVSLGNPEFMEEALERFRRENPGRDPSQQSVLRIKLDEKTEALVYPKRGDSWRLVYLDRPTARYHYKWPDLDSVVAYKVRKTEKVVIDTEKGEVIARDTVFGREPPWFFFALLRDVPTFACDGPGRWPHPKGGGLLVSRDVLIPSGQR